MKCPVCKINAFDIRNIEQELNAMSCTKCGGNWINSFNYSVWKEKNPVIPREKEGPCTITAMDLNQMKLCPECGTMLTRYHIGHGVNFTIDRCERCRGIWLDKNEWEALREKQLHDEIHFIFSHHWQKAVRNELLEKCREDILKGLIGADGLIKVKEFREWFRKQEATSAILAFLNN